MVNRKSTPDILGSLLGGDEPEAPKKKEEKPESQNTIKPEYHNTGIPAHHKDSKPESRPTVKPARQKKKPASSPVKSRKEEAPEEKIKATYYLSTEVVDALEDGWIKLRRISPTESRGQVSKSLIVEQALLMALEDLKDKGKDSQLSRKISK